jgi:hypothetical protein
MSDDTREAVKGGPSEAAVQAAVARCGTRAYAALCRPMLDAAHDPALGLDRSVRLGDVVDYVRARFGYSLADLAIAREFGEALAAASPPAEPTEYREKDMGGGWSIVSVVKPAEPSPDVLREAAKRLILADVAGESLTPHLLALDEALASSPAESTYEWRAVYPGGSASLPSMIRRSADGRLAYHRRWNGPGGHIERRTAPGPWLRVPDDEGRRDDPT